MERRELIEQMQAVFDAAIVCGCSRDLAALLAEEYAATIAERELVDS